MFCNYDVTENGIVINTTTNKILKQWKNKHGYMMVTLYFNKYKKHMQVHRMVAMKYLGKYRHLTVNHKDMNKENNNVDNLEWCTMKENLQHMHNNKKINIVKNTILKGKEHRNISYYETHPIEKRDFNRVCVARGLNINDFIQINSSEKTKSGNIKKFFIKKGDI